MSGIQVLVCIKRVPAVGGKVVLDPTGVEVDTRFLGFTMSPHEECALEEAVRLVEQHGGSSVVLTLGPADAEAQLRYAMSLGIARGVLLENDRAELGPQATARRIAEAVTAQEGEGTDFDLLLFGNEAPDTGDFQVGIRVAEALGLPCVTGIKELSVSDGVLVAKREVGRNVEVFRVGLPAVCAVMEGLNLPRYPSLPGRLRAKSKPIEHSKVVWEAEGLRKVGLRLPGGEGREGMSLGVGADAAPRVVEILGELGVLSR
jgi:electron transfer flavoprotein beta subunit